MLPYFEKRRIAQNRKRDGIDAWTQKVIKILLGLIPADEPFYYDSVFSFLQRDRTDVTKVIRVTLFFPNYPLAVDLVSTEGRANYLEARPYINRQDWEDLQANLAMKADKLSQHRCPYLLIRDIDPIDAYSLRDRVKALTGRRLRS
jgi:hypothetical protein